MTGALGRTRTAKPFRALEPESSAFANFATRALVKLYPQGTFGYCNSVCIFGVNIMYGHVGGEVDDI